MIATKSLEMALLACVCSNNEFVDVPLAYFQNERLRALYAKLEDQHYRTGKIEPAVYTETFGDIIGEMDNVSFPKSPEPIIDELAQAHKTNSAWITAHQLIKNIEAGEKIDSLLKDTTKKLSDLTMQNSGIDTYDHQKSVFAFGNSVEIASRSIVARKGISSGLPDIDNVINGWQQGYTYVVGGLKKTGKSRFALHIISEFLKNGNGGIFFSLEMKSPQVHGCIISNRAKINTGKYGTNKISCTEMVSFSQEMQSYMQQPMVLCEKSGITPDYMRAYIRKMKITMPVKWVWLITFSA